MRLSIPSWQDHRGHAGATRTTEIDRTLSVVEKASFRRLAGKSLAGARPVWSPSELKIRCLLWRRKGSSPFPGI